MFIHIKTLTGQRIKIEVESWNTVEEIKGIIESRWRVSKQSQRLFFSEYKLKNDNTLDDYLIKGESIVIASVLIANISEKKTLSSATL